MEDLFRSYWWLIFPLSWFVFGGYQSWLSYRANRDTLDLIKSYAQAGREPPPELLAKLSKRWNDGDDHEDRDDRYERRRWRRRGPRGWYHVVLFASLGAGFAYAAVTNLYGAGEGFVIVAFVMGALSLASVVSLLVDRGPKV
jgi:Flp pilus assembly protein TadB